MPPSELRRAIRDAGRVPVERDTRYRPRRVFPAAPAPDEDTALDRVTDPEARFGSYEALTRAERFRFRLPQAR